MYKDKWIQPWPMGSKIYPVVHENTRAFFSSSRSILLEPLAHGSGDWSLSREDCITTILELCTFFTFQPFHLIVQLCFCKVKLLSKHTFFQENAWKQHRNSHKISLKIWFTNLPTLKHCLSLSNYSSSQFNKLF